MVAVALTSIGLPRSVGLILPVCLVCIVHYFLAFIAIVAIFIAVTAYK